MAVIEGVEAGSVLKDLTFQCLDEAGRPAEGGTEGKLQVSWSRGTKKVKLQETPSPLPGLQVRIQIMAPFDIYMLKHIRLQKASSPYR